MKRLVRLACLLKLALLCRPVLAESDINIIAAPAPLVFDPITGNSGDPAVAELKLEQGTMTCESDATFQCNPWWEMSSECRGGGAPNFP